MLDQSRYSEANAERSSADKTPSSAMFPLLNVWNPVTDKFVAVNSQVHHAAEKVAQRWLKFTGDRLSKGMALPGQLAGCKSPNDAYLVYSQFWQDTAKDYAAEFTAITVAFVRATYAPLEPAGPGKRSNIQ
jgi:hypothetical protein